MAKTLEEPTPDEQLKRIYNQGMRVHEMVDLLPDRKYALCMLRISKAVQQSDYPALEAAINAIQGVQQATVLADHVTRPVIPDGSMLRAFIELQLRLDRTGE